MAGNRSAVLAPPQAWVSRVKKCEATTIAAATKRRPSSRASRSVVLDAPRCGGAATAASASPAATVTLLMGQDYRATSGEPDDRRVGGGPAGGRSVLGRVVAVV